MAIYMRIDINFQISNLQSRMLRMIIMLMIIASDPSFVHAPSHAKKMQCSKVHDELRFFRKTNCEMPNLPFS